MTDDEKQRVNDLLGDIDEIPESFADDSASTSGAAVSHRRFHVQVAILRFVCCLQANPYQITLSSSDGFHPARDEMRRLEAIDQRLQRLLPRSDFESIASTSPRLLSAQVSPRSRHPPVHVAPFRHLIATPPLMAAAMYSAVTSVEFQQILVRRLRLDPKANRKY